MMIAIGCDHGGYELKQAVLQVLREKGIETRDFGTHNGESCDYPDIAAAVCGAILAGECELGLLFCGTGLGMSIAANKFPGIRAACCSDCFSATLTRNHNNANVLCMGGRVVGTGLGVMMAEAFLSADYEGGRHQRRLDMITELENKK